MIYTLTLNPAIDLFIETNQLEPNIVNRTESSDIQANGKGVNVSFILHRMNIDNTALGFIGGFTGHYIESQLNEQSIQTDFIDIPGNTRINVFTNVNATQTEYKLVNKGPQVPQDKQAELLMQLQELTENDFLCISGSFAQGIDPSILIKIAEIAAQNQFKLVIDTSYQEVPETFKYHPFLVKPNEVELSHWFNYSTVPDRQTLIQLTRKAVQMGVQNVLLSLGAEGALFVNKDEVLYGNAPQITVVNTAGSGDTMLGTFLGGIVQHMPAAANLQHSIAAGSDTTQSSWITDFKNVPELEKQVTIQKLGGK
ncbi:fructose-1-phosphate kinase-like protein [Lactobacillus selangorensis]|uniref:Tagatose-6-phosphate kinase n=1 Tax=Lactobacillus selangorensis TaxID=81857 RepID=A0A0R2G5X8_9LACO|nr:1-phosphofructokinase [Lactobacillus selangorensis]KRN28972.1 fructose-1-phosphate kinase-like protein [Lactobacillus selangorensis]KRN32618.1 fructose-1-phosphate kinase-like protein [Lactobacillus selangorensis]